jgi:hypothetical protein
MTFNLKNWELLLNPDIPARAFFTQLSPKIWPAALIRLGRYIGLDTL